MRVDSIIRPTKPLAVLGYRGKAITVTPRQYAGISEPVQNVRPVVEAKELSLTR